MKVTIIGKNFRTYSKLEETIEKKFEKLGKYFSDDITANVILSHEKGRNKLEATINAKGAVFRTEQRAEDVYEAVDKVVDKLSSQMSRFKGKLQKRYNDNKSVRFEAIPQPYQEEGAQSEGQLVKTKKFDLRPMDAEEAILEMEMLQHDFFVFLNVESDNINVVYRRDDGDYGLLVPSY